MAALDKVPTNINFLQQVGFKFEIPRSPNFNYFIQKVSFPGVSLPNVFEPNPFVKNNLPGDHIEYNPLKITFKLDENLKGYFEMYDWIYSLGKPDNFEKSSVIYKKPNYDANAVYSDCSLTILNSNMQPNVKINFYDVLPETLSGFELYTDATDINYITASMEFRYRYYKYEYDM